MSDKGKSRLMIAGAAFCAALFPFLRGYALPGIPGPAAKRRSL